MYEDETFREGNPEITTGETPENNMNNGSETVTETATVYTESAVKPAAEQATYFDYTTCATEDLNRKAAEAGKAEKANRKARRAAEKAAKKEAKKQRKAQKKGSIFGKMILAASLGLCFGACAGLGLYGVQQGANYFNKDTVSAVTSTTEQQITLPENVASATTTDTTVSESHTQYVTYVSNDITGMVDEVMPAMVSIVNSYTTTSYNFWGQYTNRESQASGSGIIVGKTDTQLLIATNNHVVEDAKKLEVTFIDGSTGEAIIKGTDADMDLAVIAVNLDSLDASTKAAITVAKLGDSDSLKLGEPVVAIGNALGYGQSVTTGIISALNREIEDEAGNTNSLIQTDAAINPGNSGGALLNINGEVIGINSSKIGGSTVEGMGYAIPISSASPILSELMERETRDKVAENEMGYMGISMQAISDDVIQSLGLPKGIYVTDVSEGSAAEKAGVQKRDIIVKFDGQKVTSPSELKERLEYYKAGETCTITIQRATDGEYVSYDLEITLGQRPSSLQ